MSDQIVALRTYGNELEARLAAAILEANEIPAQVVSDNAGGAYPALAILTPVRLLVRAEDAALAIELLDASPDAGSDDAGPADG